MPDEHPAFEAARRPERWLDTAEMLERAAARMPQATPRGFAEHRSNMLMPTGTCAGSFITHDVLPSLQLFPVRMTLLGQSLENLVKGIIVAERAPAVRKSGIKLVYTWGSRHLGLDLFEQDAGLELRDEEKEIVETLAEFVLWAGRFPAPKWPPQADQKWDSYLEPVYWRLSRRLRVKLKLGIRIQQRLLLERDELGRFKKSDHDGVVVFEDAMAGDIPIVNVSCECGSFFRLSPRFLATVCLCGKLYHGRPKHVAGGGMRMDIDIYPAVVPPDAVSDEAS